MPDKTLTDKGYLAVPSTSNQEVETELEDTINEDELAVSEDENSATNQEKTQPEKTLQLTSTTERTFNESESTLRVSTLKPDEIPLQGH